MFESLEGLSLLLLSLGKEVKTNILNVRLHRHKLLLLTLIVYETADEEFCNLIELKQNAN